MKMSTRTEADISNNKCKSRYCNIRSQRKKKEENLKTLEAERAEIEEEGHYHLLRRL